MSSLPQRHSLSNQMADILRQEIAQGGWREWLPGERALCEKYQISRNTLRAALDQLKRDKVIEARHGAGNRILAAAALRTDRLRSRDVALLSPEPLERLRPTQTLWIDELRVMLCGGAVNCTCSAAGNISGPARAGPRATHRGPIAPAVARSWCAVSRNPRQPPPSPAAPAWPAAYRGGLCRAAAG